MVILPTNMLGNAELSHRTYAGKNENNNKTCTYIKNESSSQLPINSFIFYYY